MVDTSEFQDIRSRLVRFEDRVAPNRQEDGPVLRRRLSSSSVTIDAAGDDAGRTAAKTGN